MQNKAYFLLEPSKSKQPTFLTPKKCAIIYFYKIIKYNICFHSISNERIWFASRLFISFLKQVTVHAYKQLLCGYKGYQDMLTISPIYMSLYKCTGFAYCSQGPCYRKPSTNHYDPPRDVTDFLGCRRTRATRTKFSSRKQAFIASQFFHLKYNKINIYKTVYF